MEHEAHGHGHTDRFSEAAATWDDEPGHAERARTVAAAVRAAVPLTRGTRVLEIGGGTGLLARELVDDIGSALVTDVAPGMVEVTRAKLDDRRFEGWSARRYDIEHDPVLEERFDLVIGMLTLHHMGDVGAVVRTCSQLLEPGGHLALVDLDHDPEGAFHAGVEGFDGHDGFPRESVAAWLAEAGFVDVTLSDAGSVLKGEPEREFPMFLAVGRRA